MDEVKRKEVKDDNCIQDFGYISKIGFSLRSSSTSRCVYDSAGGGDAGLWGWGGGRSKCRLGNSGKLELEKAEGGAERERYRLSLLDIYVRNLACMV